MKHVLFSTLFCDRLLCCYRTMSKWAMNIDYLIKLNEILIHTKCVHIQSTRKSESYWLMVFLYAFTQQPMLNSRFGAITIELCARDVLLYIECIDAYALFIESLWDIRFLLWILDTTYVPHLTLNDQLHRIISKNFLTDLIYCVWHI